MTDTLKTSLAHWPELPQSVFVPHTKTEYLSLAAPLDGLVDEFGNNEFHPVASLMEVVGLLIGQFKDEQVSEIRSQGPRL